MKRLVLCLCLFFATTASAQLVCPTCPPPCSDKLAVTAFWLNPPAPKANDNVTVTMSIRNQCTSGTLNVPWDIARNSGYLGQGMVAIAPGATVNVSAQWVAVAGSSHFYGDADPAKTIYDSNRLNNMPTAIDISVAPLLETQLLSYQKALYAGASFPVNPESSACRCGVDGSDGSVAFWNASNVVGSKMNPEAFKNFSLKNGWKVKSAGVKAVSSDPTSTLAGLPATGWNWLSGAPGPPAPGQTSPYMNVHMWVTAGARLSVAMNVYIEGPMGTDP